MKIDHRDRAQNIEELQTLLRGLSYYDPLIPRISADGIYGRETEDAVRAFQRTAGLPETGTTDLETWTALVRTYEQLTKPHRPGKSIVPLYNPLILENPGGYPDFVALMQVMLRTVLPTDITVNGIYDEPTAGAIVDLQRLFGLPGTGVIDRETWEALAALYDLETRKSQSDPPAPAQSRP